MKKVAVPDVVGSANCICDNNFLFSFLLPVPMSTGITKFDRRVTGTFLVKVEKFLVTVLVSYIQSYFVTIPDPAHITGTDLYR
jgi:hypothetical protein